MAPKLDTTDRRGNGMDPSRDRAEPLYPPELAERYRAAGHWLPRTIGEELHECCRRFADRTAVATLTEELSYAELDSRTDRIAAAFIDLGLQPGDPVVFQMDNEAPTVIAWYACIKAGLLPIASLPNHGAYEIGHIAGFTRARVHIVQADYRTYDLVNLGRALRDEHESLEFLVVARGVDAPDTLALEELGASTNASRARAVVDARQHELDPEGLALFQLSGGTTSIPKVIPHSHVAYAGHSRTWARHWGWDESIVTLHSWPILHHAGLFTALQPVLQVGGLCVVSSRNDAETLLGLVERYRVNVLTVSPALVAGASDIQGSGAPRFDTSSLTHLYGMNDEQLLAEAEAVLGGEARAQFGMSEGAALACFVGDGVEARHRTSGAAIDSDTEVRVLDPGSERQLPPGEVGEMAFRGPFVVRGYYQAPDINGRSFTSDHFLRTGDLAVAIDVDGRLHYRVVGRLKDNISRGGEKFMAPELESLLLGHPDVAEVAVIGMPDSRLGERVCAYIVPSQDTSPPTVAAFTDWLSKLGVAKYKWPERVEIVDELPTTAVGKVNKPYLRADIERKLATETAGGTS